VYAGTRESFAHLDERVTPLLLDVTDASLLAALDKSTQQSVDS
jgi:hypothetical protein